MNLFDRTYTPEELKAIKNRIFAEIIATKQYFASLTRKQLYHKFIYLDGKDVFAFQLGTRKTVVLQNEEFNIKYEQNHPNVLIIIDNRPHVQKIAISVNEEAFSSPQVVANILQLNFNVSLDKYSLQISVNPILDRRDFWQLIKSYEDRITSLRFEIIKPNMTNISNSLSEGLKELVTATNSFKTRLDLNAPERATLENLNEKNIALAGIADYSIEGGSTEISLKVKGLRSYIKTDGTVRKVSIDEAEIKGTPDKISTIFQKILSNGD
ncbi:hypothetical protein [Fibrella aestuarina]|uniref:hypothetical protein n=1 Tax=Fibrella aestuarina TaxID=651143 RepID=UPI0002EF0EEE|nr:hypothetical protein [Fibrella aestuarina]